jgi:hypothetical protein
MLFFVAAATLDKSRAHANIATGRTAMCETGLPAVGAGVAI